MRTIWCVAHPVQASGAAMHLPCSCQIHHPAPKRRWIPTVCLTRSTSFLSRSVLAPAEVPEQACRLHRRLVERGELVIRGRAAGRRQDRV